MTAEIYVHIPFCVKKCSYCDFFSCPAGREVQRRYFRELRREIEEFEKKEIAVSSVFFGGGTPSIAEEGEISGILSLLREKFTILPEAEITIEANPGTLNEKNLKEYQNAGINRLSIGLQSADDEILKKLGRVHSFERFSESFQKAREAGFTNISVDLMSGLPGDTPENFEKGLLKVLSLNPEHLSVYSLIIAENTPFEALYGEEGSRREELPSEEEDRRLVHRTRELLHSHGYRQYEISNYAHPGFESRHNIGYWTGVPYYGFGSAAASFSYVEKEEPVLAERTKNADSLSYLECGKTVEERLTKEDLMAEFMILGLRMTEGISEQAFQERFLSPFPENYRKILKKYEKFGVLLHEDDRYFLTSYGQDVCNVLMEEFL